MTTQRFLFTLLLILVATTTSERVQSEDKKAEGKKAENSDRKLSLDEAILTHRRISTRPTDLLAYLKDRVPKELSAAEVASLIKQLGSQVFSEREAAVASLSDAGPSILPQLLSALKDADPERVLRVQQVIDVIKKKRDQSTVTLHAAIRVLLHHHPEGLSPILFRLFPMLTDEALVEQVWFALDAATAKAEKVDSVFELALKDSSPERRAISGFLLARRGTAEQRIAVGALLKDLDPHIRLRTAQGLLGRGEFDSAVPALIDLLVQKPVVIAWQAEELLSWLAGDTAPKAQVETGGQTGIIAERAWREWWEQNRNKLSWDKLCQEPRRPTLCLLDGWANRRDDLQSVSLVLVGSSGRVVWFPGQFSKRMCVSGFSSDDRVFGIHLDGSRDAMKKAPGVGFTSAFLELNLVGDIRTAIDLGLTRPERFVLCQNWVGGKVLVACSNRYGMFTPKRGDFVWHPLQPPKARTGTRLTEAVFIAEAGGLLWYEWPREFRAIDPMSGAVIPFDERSKPSVAKRTEEIVVPGGTRIICDKRRERVIERDSFGRVVWEIPNENRGDYPKLVFPLLRLGFADLGKDRIDLNKDVQYRIKGLRSPDRGRRMLAAKALSADPLIDSDQAIPEVLRTLGDELMRPQGDHGSYPYLAQELRKALATSGQSGIRIAQERLGDTSAQIRAASINTLTGAVYRQEKGIKKNALWTVAQAALKDPSPLVRAEALGALGVFQDRIDEIVPLLIAGLKDHALEHDKGDTVSATAARVLIYLGPKGKPAFDALLEAVCVPHRSIAWEAMRAIIPLTRNEPDLARFAIAAFWKVARDNTRPELRDVGMSGILNLVSSSPPKATDVIDILAEEKAPEALRIVALRVLVALGSKASEESLPILVKRIAAPATSVDEKIEILRAISQVKRIAMPELAALRSHHKQEKNALIKEMMRAILDRFK